MLPDDSPALRVRVVSADPLAHGGLELLLRRLGFALLEDRDGDGDGDGGFSTVVVWDLGADGGTPAPRVSADEPLLALVPDAADARGALAQGASGVMRRDTDPERLAAAVRALASDLVVLDDLLAAEVLPAGDDAVTEPLTPREEEVLALMAEGYSNKDIGQALDVSEHTARFHVRAILAKLDARNRAEAVAIAARLGLLAF